MGLLFHDVAGLQGVQAQKPTGNQPIDPFELLRIANMMIGPQYSAVITRFFGGVDPWRQPMGLQTDSTTNVSIQSQTFGTQGAQYSVEVNSDVDLDCETSFMTLVKNEGGVDKDFSIAAYMKYWNDGGVRKWRTYTSVLATSDPKWTDRQMGILGNYSRHIDPVLFSNINSDGVGPKRTYLVGLQENDVTSTPPQTPQAITIQHSDDGGRIWSTSREVFKNETSGYYLDKPDMVVSWESGANRGFVYVAFMRLNFLQGPPPATAYDQELFVTRSEDGGITWTTPVLVIKGRVHAPQIAVATTNPRVYLSWVNQDKDRIDFAYSDDKGSTWKPTDINGNLVPEIAASGPMKIGENRHLDFTPSGVTVPQMRFDHVNNQVFIVWHQSEYEVRGTHTGPDNSTTTLVDSTKDFVALGVKIGDYVRNTQPQPPPDSLPNDTYCFVSSVAPTQLGLTLCSSWRPVTFTDKDFDNGDSYVVKAKKTDIYFVRKTINGWQSKVRLDVPLLHDQFQPSIDFHSSPSQLLVGYLDRSDDTANPNKLYRARWIKTDASGTRIDSGLVAGWFDSNPENNTHSGFIGDYTDTWFWPYSFSHGPHWHLVFDGRKEPPTNNGNIWASGIN